MNKKFCPRCKAWQPTFYFYKNLKRPSGLRSWCKSCCNSDNKKREPKYREYRKRYAQSETGKKVRERSIVKHRGTIKGHLGQVFQDIKSRCNNPRCKAYKNYGGRGIQNKFVSLDRFRDYVTKQLHVDPRKLQIDRIDNDGHYEEGNIRFVTARENLQNRRV